MFGNNENIAIIKKEPEDFDDDKIFNEAEMTIKKNDNLEGDQDQTLLGGAICLKKTVLRHKKRSSPNVNLACTTVALSQNRYNFSEDFTFIRSCLNNVLHVDAAQRHDIVREISLKIRKIEAVVTGRKAPTEATAVLNSNTVMETISGETVSGGLKSDSERFDQDEDGSSSKGSNEAVHTPTVTGLLSRMKDGRFKCNVCDCIITTLDKKFCGACSSFASRLRRKCKEEGRTLPECRHEDYSGRSHCKSCRYRMYNDPQLNNEIQSKAAKLRTKQAELQPKKIPKIGPKNKKRAGERQKCIICEKTTQWFKGWRCSACFVWYTRLIAKYQAGEELPDCEHGGSYAGMGCKGCRFRRLQKETTRREPNLAAKLPSFQEDSACSEEGDE